MRLLINRVLPKSIIGMMMLAVVLLGCTSAPPDGSESLVTPDTAQAASGPTATATSAATPNGAVTATPSPTVRPSSTPLPAPTETPSPTGTPRVRATHTVVEGDNLWDISQKYGTTMDALRMLNALEGSDLAIGQVLYLPGEGDDETPDITPVTQAQATPDTATSTATLSPTVDSTPLAPTPELAPGERVACAATARQRALDMPADPIRIVTSAGRLYLVAGGDLYELAVDDLEGEGGLTPRSALPGERRVGRFTIQELVDVAVEPETGDLLLLDKSNDIYRRTTTGHWSMAFESRAVPGVWPDPQLLSLAVSAGNVYALDADSARIWRFAPGATLPTAYLTDAKLVRGVDLTLAPDGAGASRLYALTYDGVLVRSGAGMAAVAGGPAASRWPAQIVASGGRLLAVDGQARQVAILNASGGVEGRVTYAFAGMQRLRSAALAGDRLYAVAGRMLYIANLNETGEGCPGVSYDDRYLYDGVDLRQVLAGFRIPFPGARLHSRPRSYPGARRLYRFGVHEGIDFYPGDAPRLDYGSPIHAVVDGVITRIDTDFAEITPDEYAVMIERIRQEHRTPPDILDRLRGRQVYVEHAPGIELRYCHLTDVPTGNVGDRVEEGDLVGTVGVTGTSSGVYGTRVGPHLHMEIWIHGRYLGHGLTIPETIRLWHGVFGG